MQTSSSIASSSASPANCAISAGGFAACFLMVSLTAFDKRLLCCAPSFFRNGLPRFLGARFAMGGLLEHLEQSLDENGHIHPVLAANFRQHFVHIFRELPLVDVAQYCRRTRSQAMCNASLSRKSSP